MILTQIEGDILIAFISAVFGSIITLMFQWIVHYIGSTKIYFKIIDLEDVKTFKYCYVITDEYILEEELNYYSKYKFNKEHKYYLIINNKDYYKLNVDLKEHPRYLKLSKLSRKERKILDGPFK